MPPKPTFPRSNNGERGWGMSLLISLSAGLVFVSLDIFNFFRIALSRFIGGGNSFRGQCFFFIARRLLWQVKEFGRARRNLQNVLARRKIPRLRKRGATKFPTTLAERDVALGGPNPSPIRAHVK